MPEEYQETAFHIEKIVKAKKYSLKVVAKTKHLKFSKTLFFPSPLHPIFW